MTNHLLAIPILGHYAVHGFFILSGYLMTLIMVKTYGYSASGVGRFCLNRILRLYPAYWIVLAFSILAIFWLGEENSKTYRAFMFIPGNLSQWLQNLTLTYWSTFPTTVLPRVSPPTWALTVEIFFYALIALGISRTRRSTTIWFLSSMVFMLTTHVLGLGYGYRYDFIFAGTLAFSLGAMIFHYQELLNSFISRHNKSALTTGVLTLLIMNCAAALIFGREGMANTVAVICFYTNYILNATLIILLINTTAPTRFKKLDKILGDFSYPLYLMHWQVGFVCSMLIFGAPINGSSIPGIQNFIVTLFVSLVLCNLIVKSIEVPIQRIRGRLKSTGVKATASKAASGV
ncbi:acyltransferase family protein [Pseudomonas nitroreducens]|uniref:acyltransferase family protein n=1 Tax=Pseudomonas nitroreducens TaxID=46680 RepID=UPI00209D9C62|nr:peptidoglycan/LPS O-acetylase OafA/YrhL [Pseudomonas nitroreducens]